MKDEFAILHSTGHAVLGREIYIQILKNFYGFSAGLEGELNDFLDLEEVSNALENRKKSSWYIQSMTAYGVQVEDLSDLMVERSAPTGEDSWSHGNDILKLWKNFQCEFLGQCASDEDKDEVESSATETFERLEEWVLNHRGMGG